MALLDCGLTDEFSIYDADDAGAVIKQVGGRALCHRHLRCCVSTLLLLLPLLLCMSRGVQGVGWGVQACKGCGSGHEDGGTRAPCVARGLKLSLGPQSRRWCQSTTTMWG